MLHGIIIATLLVGCVGVFVGVFLGIAGIKFAVQTDPKEEQVLNALPGNNCGGCGYAGCSGLAAAIAKGEAPVNGCPVGGEPVAKVISDIMGVDAGESVRMTAFVKCQGDCDRTRTDYEYTGVEDCSVMAFVPGGGPKSCNHGCMGYGNCVKACAFDAIHVINGIAVVDKDACKACGKCVSACPKGLIELVPYDAKVRVSCNSKDKGPVVLKACDTGCIGCGICAKNCPLEAISVTDNLAHIDYSVCSGCMTCVEKCPKKAITVS